MVGPNRVDDPSWLGIGCEVQGGEALEAATTKKEMELGMLLDFPVLPTSTMRDRV